MKKIIPAILVLVLLSPLTFSQRVIFQSDFENITLNSDSLPSGWTKWDVDNNNPLVGWAVRDTVVNFGGNTRPKANNYSAKSLEIPWYAGNGGNFINDDWVFTDSFTVQQDDSLIFWMLQGSDSTFQAYLDSMQVLVCLANVPGIGSNKLATIVSNDSEGVPLNNNVWTEHTFDLSSFAGQSVYISFRYYMDVSVDGIWCNIDDLFIGNRSAIGIKKISTDIPRTYALRQNYPNPFNPTTYIEFDLPKTEFVNLIIYNALGQIVRELVNENREAGSYRVDFNATNLPSGTYFYRIAAGDFVQTNKMVLVK